MIPGRMGHFPEDAVPEVAGSPAQSRSPNAFSIQVSTARRVALCSESGRKPMSINYMEIGGWSPPAAGRHRFLLNPG